MPAEGFEPVGRLQISPDGIRGFAKVVQVREWTLCGHPSGPARRAATIEQKLLGSDNRQRVEFLKIHFTQASARVCRKFVAGPLLRQDRCESARASLLPNSEFLFGRYAGNQLSTSSSAEFLSTEGPRARPDRKRRVQHGRLRVNNCPGNFL